MSYISNNLLKNEKIIYSTRMHWIVFILPAILLAATFVFSVFAPLLFPGYIPFLNIRLASLVILICFLAAIFSGVSAFIRYVTSEYGITNKRILIKTGWIRRASLELFIDKVEAIYVDQSIPGRMLDYGSLRVVGTGGTQDPFFYVPRPLLFRRIAQEQIDIDIEQHSSPPRSNSKDSL